MEKKQYPVVVIGCGASGIACLSKLAEAGIDAIGLEASDRIGGRICTEEFGAGVVDLGAAWCHGEVNNLVYQLASPHNLLGRPEPTEPEGVPDWFVYSDGTLVPAGNAAAITETIKENVDKCDKNNMRSISEYVRTGVSDGNIATDTATIPITEPFLEWYERENHLGGQRDPKTGKSLYGLVKHEPCAGEFWLNWKGQGYKTILDVMMKTHPAFPKPLPIRIQYKKEVANILWVNPNPDPEDPERTVIVTCADRTVIKASRVVVAVSLGVLKNRYLTMFTPPLPAENISAINNLQFCVLNKIYIRFQSPWWPTELTSFKILWRDEDKEKFDAHEKWITGIYGFRTVEHQPNVLLAWLYGTHAEEMERVSLDDVTKGVNKLLDMMRSNFDVTPVTTIKRSTWASNPLTRGSYSYRAVTTEEAGTGAEALASPLVCEGKTVVCFAGEATSSRYHNAVHGAIDAGFREAQRIIDAVL